ncbi:bifunctional diaminohydroxyphosphoribosylaminopyrimidine deaminase/5-amino-6-(5-phosphoribosylamino)uracil reductase RibD [Flagellimonas halotolerans]|uniref:Riboflavin biosynthesis protein RibD n=1 Tax=Flagellimonas halotolerans TaxID=3112164 RepID=A0ABU6IUN2_9FLAO|nr:MULTISPECIES: bifunctional diaminohydroxyphosphoribosylaminopyrimidine deaminase/5-amino-6-(5-phosphoribosylamino)uracil reductase RibD [unclassified Allomuricauda]MEC3966980.1 bifunctional diaminohydroxyphosphoribosylaminopyrimidine deaminase/5-amino-6-(5-phosphoribosylamino)uracil reductase RibD [Muricauda sp. SYSU M86414]MEC4266843.1 bifunctional diaminohydroxyphosphoribosylaminopyrimidine deaminase/5-amino-6-(5-phosphoribosylamino)uracil reductase RibD [Muricauda sp. SYSU M84420]
MNIHQKYILRCIELGKKGLGTTAPNPMVGCVIVHNKKVIGEGFTAPYGGPHAEVNAINSVKDKSLLKESLLYVTLEPCSHYGKTPPCADLIAKHQLKEVLIGLQDPHDKVAGKGIKKLEDAGCKVTIGVLEDECRQHHKRFLTFQEKRRPYIILKWAESDDGFLAPDASLRSDNPEPFWITNPYSKQLVHQWRSQEQAILVGTRTVLEDNPKLTTRNWAGKNPIRVVLDKDLKIDASYHLLDTSVQTIVLTTIEDASKYIEGVVYVVIDFSKPLAMQICNVLHQHNITSVIVEGGAKMLQTFIDENLWDEARVFKGSVCFENGLPAPKLQGTLHHQEKILTDTLSFYTND